MNDRRDRFKVGDVVVKVRDDLNRVDWHRIGTVVTITLCEGDGLPWYGMREKEECLDDQQWELEVIADSPLYKALK